MYKSALPFLLVAVLCCSSFAEEDDSISEQLKAATNKVTGKTYLLRYKFRKGETIRWKVTHLATTEARIQNSKQSSQSRSISTKAWKITDVDDEGRVTFVHLVEDVSMWQSLKESVLSGEMWVDRGKGSETRYNSKTDDQPPLIYESVAETVGKPLAAVKIDAAGNIVNRESARKSPNFGLGKITIPFPQEAIGIGKSWHTPGSVAARLDDRRVKRVNLRHRYTLKKVVDNIATIHVETEVLTPIHEQNVKVQLLQQMTRGDIQFDIEAGRLVSQQIDWDETVVNFNGADSIMNYVARFTEKLLDDDSPAKLSPTAKTASAADSSDESDPEPRR